MEKNPWEIEYEELVERGEEALKNPIVINYKKPEWVTDDWD